MKRLIGICFCTFLIFSFGCRRAVEENNEIKENNISIYMEKEILGEKRRIKVFETKSPHPFVIELYGANMDLTMKEPPKDLEEQVEEEVNKTK